MVAISLSRSGEGPGRETSRPTLQQYKYVLCQIALQEKKKEKKKSGKESLTTAGNIEGICIFSDCDSNTYTREWAVEMGTDIPPLSVMLWLTTG